MSVDERSSYHDDFNSTDVGLNASDFRARMFEQCRIPWGKLPNNINMSNDEALVRIREGASILLLDFPNEREVGFDMMAWVAGPIFKGFKMIPPGLHFLYWGGGHGMMEGIWYKAVKGRVLVRQWDKELEGERGWQATA